METLTAPLNPVHEWRLVNNYSLNEFAKATGVSKVAVQRTESGCYTTVPSGIVDAILDRPTVLDDGTPLTHSDEISTAYRVFQARTRRLTYLTSKLSPTLPVGVSPAASPVVTWRLSSGVSSQLLLCKLLCMHPHVINQLETGKQRKLGSQMVEALTQAGYDDEFIEELSLRQAEYYDLK